MKKILLVIFLFLVTGCNITYNLNIDKVYTEDITIEKTSSSSSDDSEFKLLLERGIPLYFNKSDLLYKTNIDELDGNFNMHLNGNFDSSNKDSFAIYNACENYNITKDDDKTTIKASNFKIFNTYPYMDTLTINVTCHNVISNNADSVEGDIYTWVITKDNYSTKDVSISFTGGAFDKISNSFEDPMVKFTFVLFTLIFIGFVFYLIIKKVFIRRNAI